MNEGLSPEALMRQRDQAASDLVRALVLINGGGAAVLLAFLQAIWGTEKGLAKWIIAALVTLAFGATTAAAFHFFRYRASWYWQHNDTVHWKKFQRLYLTSARLSLIAFILGVAVVAIGAWRLLP